MRRRQFFTALATAVITFVCLQVFVGSRWEYYRGYPGYHRHHYYQDYRPGWRQYDNEQRNERHEAPVQHDSILP